MCTVLAIISETPGWVWKVRLISTLFRLAVYFIAVRIVTLNGRISELPPKHERLTEEKYLVGVHLSEIH